MTPPDAAPSAVPLSRRDDLPDLLRGVAIGMILLVNMQDFAGYAVWRQLGVDRAAQSVMDLLVNGKGISLFAMLFGAGAWSVYARHGAVYLLRRLLALTLLGALHFTLLWHGDIMAQYALSALPLLLLLRLPRPVQVAAAALLAAWWMIVNEHQTALLGALGGHFYDADVPRILAPEPSGLLPYLAGLQSRLSELVGTETAVVTYGGPWLLALMLLGALAQRSGMLSRPQEHRRAWRAVMVGGFLVGAPLTLVFAVANAGRTVGLEYVAEPLRFCSGLGMAFGYAGLLAGVVARGQAPSPLLAAGRLSFTTYISQSLVMTFVFYGWGLGQYGTWGALACLGFGLAFYALQVGLAAWYVPRHGRGPLERLLRWMVYRRA